MWVMVGLDQWIAIDGRTPQQWPTQPPSTEVGRLTTRGLSGCVGLVLSWEGGQIALAHVFSGCTDGTGKPPGLDTWNGPGGYRERLDHALDVTQAAIPGAATQEYRFGILVFSEPTPTRTVELLAGWLRDKGIGSAEYPNLAGCDVSAGLDGEDEMSVSAPSLLAQYLTSAELESGPGGQMIACENLSELAHPADPQQPAS